MDSSDKTEDARRERYRGKRSATQRAADWKECERLALRGLTQEAIAEEISRKRPYAISRQTVQYDLAQITARWRESAVASVASARAKQLRRLELLNAEASDSWEQSKTRGEPNAQFLRVLVDIHDRVAKLLGLDAPIRTEVSGSDGGPILLAGATLTPEAKAEILRRHLGRIDDRATPATEVPNE